MEIDHKGLQYVSEQLFLLSEKTPWSKEDRQRSSNLIALRASVQAGARLQDLLKDDLQEREKRLGLPVTRFEKSAPPVRLEKRMEEARAWAHFIATGRVHERDLELRDEAVGGNKPGTLPQYMQGSMGSFVPRDFYDRVAFATRIIEPLTNPSVVRFVETENGRTMQFSWVDDNDSQAVVAAENSDQSANERDISFASEVDIRAFSYRTPMWRLSIEALQDLDEMITAIDMFVTFTAQRVARGVGRDLISGTGVNMPLGLIPSLQISGANSVVAIGSSESTGGPQTGSNSIGYSDCVNLMEAVDNSWVDNPGFAFLCHPQTRSSLRRILDKYGRPLVNFEAGTGLFYMFDKPVYVSYSMPQIGNAQIPLVAGDFNMWITRTAKSGNRVQVFKEAPGLIEKGEVGLRSFSRWDGAMLCNSYFGHQSVPFAYLVNHS